MQQSIPFTLQALAGITRQASAVAVRMVSLRQCFQLNSYHGYWFSHWRA
ncbi:MULTISPECIES: hypothetical protein [Pseudomonas syringae group]|nr:hypothetical protein [Pseudomonas coronafaciens]